MSAATERPAARAAQLAVAAAGGHWLRMRGPGPPGRTGIYVRTKYKIRLY